MDPAREALGLVSLNNFSRLWAMGRAPVGFRAGVGVIGLVRKFDKEGGWWSGLGMG